MKIKILKMKMINTKRKWALGETTKWMTMVRRDQSVRRREIMSRNLWKIILTIAATKGTMGKKISKLKNKTFMVKTIKAKKMRKKQIGKET